MVGFDEKKIPISDVSSNVFSTFSSHKGNSTKGKTMNLEPKIVEIRDTSGKITS